MNAHDEFAAAVSAGRDIADDRVQYSLYRSACEGNVTACIFWLCNRRPDRWRHVQRIEHTGGGDGQITIADLVRSAAERNG